MTVIPLHFQTLYNWQLQLFTAKSGARETKILNIMNL